jgi:hypothetical protein
LASDVPFGPSEVVQLGSSVKFMNSIAKAQGLVLRFEFGPLPCLILFRKLAIHHLGRNNEYAMKTFEQSIEKLQQAIRSEPNNPEALLYYAEVLW